MQSLTGKVAVVTGAASGIGLALARRFGQDGMRVVMADIEQGALERESAALAGEGIEVLARVTDASLESDVEALAEATLQRFGGVHIVCNNAGVGSRGLKVADLPRRDFEWVIGVNLWGVINGIRAFLPRLLAQDEGHIVNTASVSGLYHHPRMGPYNATKAAVVALSETIRYELDEDGSNVGISVLCPSWVRTNISSAVRNLPERLHYELTPQQADEMLEYKARRRQQLRDEAIDADEVAVQVRDAVLANRFYVITHPDSIDNMRARFGRIVNGEDPVKPVQ
ncbi:MAG TPA: SDR family NAD(P)-dependent oxidoreductase [Ilumatobacter sp.]|nr:SDR family NAD(P)-dependent oxidoreductase [Ilumatobacter sp.]